MDVCVLEDQGRRERLLGLSRVLGSSHRSRNLRLRPLALNAGAGEPIQSATQHTHHCSLRRFKPPEPEQKSQQVIEEEW